MFENGQMKGIGISFDQNGIKYVGEHNDGKRDGLGILYMKDGREYQGTWRDNRMHGRGYEFINNQKYMVFTDNGKRFECVTMGQDKKPEERDFGNYEKDGKIFSTKKNAMNTSGKDGSNNSGSY